MDIIASLAEYDTLLPLILPILLTILGTLFDHSSVSVGLKRIPSKVCLAMLSVDTYGLVRLFSSNVPKSSITTSELGAVLLFLTFSHLVLANVSFRLQRKLDWYRILGASVLAVICVVFAAALLFPSPYV